MTFQCQQAHGGGVPPSLPGPAGAEISNHPSLHSGAVNPASPYTFTPIFAQPQAVAAPRPIYEPQPLPSFHVGDSPPYPTHNQQDVYRERPNQYNTGPERILWLNSVLVYDRVRVYVPKWFATWLKHQ